MAGGKEQMAAILSKHGNVTNNTVLSNMDNKLGLHEPGLILITYESDCLVS